MLMSSFSQVLAQRNATAFKRAAASRARVLWQEYVEVRISTCHNYVANARVAHTAGVALAF
mgnify:CR=1 FL=1